MAALQFCESGRRARRTETVQVGALCLLGAAYEEVATMLGLGEEVLENLLALLLLLGAHRQQQMMLEAVAVLHHPLG